MLLRLAVAFSGIAYGISAFKTPIAIGAWAVGMLAILTGVLLLIGLLTPVAAAAAGLGYLVEAAWSLLTTDVYRLSYLLSAIDLAAVSVALLCLGPGAFSLDALLFGRREIIIPESGRRPRS